MRSEWGNCVGKPGVCFAQGMSAFMAYDERNIGRARDDAGATFHTINKHSVAAKEANPHCIIILVSRGIHLSKDGL